MSILDYIAKNEYLEECEKKIHQTPTEMLGNRENQLDGVATLLSL